jgi:hypothetical protein
LEERKILLSLQEIDLEVREAKLVEVQARGLHSLDGWDLSMELEELCARLARVKDDCATEAGKLSKWVMEISNSLVDVGMLPIRYIPQLPKMAQEVLAAAGLILERLQEVHASDAGPWD